MYFTDITKFSIGKKNIKQLEWERIYLEFKEWLNN